MWFANISPFSIDCLVLLLIVPFVVKLFRLVLSHWLICVFVSYTFDIACPGKLFPRSVSRSFPSVFSSRNVAVLGLTFKPSIFLS